MATTVVPAGITDWVDLGLPGTGSVMVVQPTSGETLFSIADVKPGISPPIGFHLDPDVLTSITLNTPTVTHVWAFQPSKGSVMPTGGEVLVYSLASQSGARVQATAASETAPVGAVGAAARVHVVTGINVS